MTLLLVWCAAAVLLGLLIGGAMRIADRIEGVHQPDDLPQDRARSTV